MTIVYVVKFSKQQELFINTLAQYFSELEQKTITTRKVSKLITNAIYGDKTMSFVERRQMLQLPEWFKNCGLDWLIPETVSNIIKSWVAEPEDIIQ